MVVPGRGLEDVRDKFLGVSIIEGKPGTLDLNHDAVSKERGKSTSVVVLVVSSILTIAFALKLFGAF